MTDDGDSQLDLCDVKAPPHRKTAGQVERASSSSQLPAENTILLLDGVRKVYAQGSHLIEAWPGSISRFLAEPFKA
jgi:hypothetical protein